MGAAVQFRGQRIEINAAGTLFLEEARAVLAGAAAAERALQDLAATEVFLQVVASEQDSRLA